MSTPSIDRTSACLNLIATGANLRLHGDMERAEKAFTAALLLTHGPDAAANPTESFALRALTLYQVVVLHERAKNPDAQDLRKQAAAFLERSGTAEPLPAELLPLYQELMASVLVALGEYRLALPYCEAAIRYQVDSNDAVSIALSMSRAGKCYLRMGLRDHAVVPLREAVKIYRRLAGDPRLPGVLLDLGSAYGKNNPEEAERCYREVADYHVSRGQLESATPAWINLAIRYNEQKRYEEALELYQRALRVREQSPRTPPERLGTVLNNIANNYRRMGRFEEATASVERAQTLLDPVGGYPLACALGTRGLILRDTGRDAEAVEWFRKSAAEHQRQPSPNLETLSEEIENEAAALERLGRVDEAADAHRRLDAVKAQMAAFAPVDRESNFSARETRGAVLIELSLGSRSGVDLTPLQTKLTEAVENADAGYLGGRVVIPETATFFYYGEDGDALFRAVEPILQSEPLCAGGTVTIRDQGKNREVSIAQKLM